MSGNCQVQHGGTSDTAEWLRCEGALEIAHSNSPAPTTATCSRLLTAVSTWTYGSFEQNQPCTNHLKPKLKYS